MQRGRQSPAIGIDLGTTNSCVAVWMNGKVEILDNDQGLGTTPSYVAFNETEILVGEGAKNQAAGNPTNTIFAVKRLIGRRFSDECVRRDSKLWPFKVIPGSEDQPTIAVTYKNKKKLCSPEEISSMVLSKMKETAEASLRCDVKNAVITVPAYFSDSQRKATRDAAKIAGLNVLQMINEPTAAALAYSFNKRDTSSQAKRTILVFDLGGGTFDVSLVEVHAGGRVDVKATDGNTHLGGEDFDSRMVHHLLDLFRQTHHHDLTGDPRAIRILRTECEKAKRNLSSSNSTEIYITSLYNGIDFKMQFTRAKFEDLNRDLFKSCLEPVKRCLEHARIDKSRVHDIMLVGGSTRIPMVRNMLKDFFRVEYLFTSISADEAVAYGASILAAKLSNQTEELVRNTRLADVTPHSLGVDVRGGKMHVVIGRNTSVPCRNSYKFTTAADNMTSLRFRVCEGEEEDTKENILLGEFYMHGLRMAPKGSVRIDVVFDVDKEGILKVSGKDLDTQQTVQITIANTGRLGKDVVEKLAGEAEKLRIDDRKKRKAMVAKDELERYLSWVDNSIEEYRVWSVLGIGGSNSRRALESVIRDVRQWLGTNISSALEFEFEDKKNAVRTLWEPVRAQLSNRGVEISDFRA